MVALNRAFCRFLLVQTACFKFSGTRVRDQSLGSGVESLDLGVCGVPGVEGPRSRTTGLRVYEDLVELGYEAFLEELVGLVHNLVFRHGI